MQQIEALIEKLKAQVNSKADVSLMLVTLQMIHKEITGGLKETEMLGASHVTVMVPNVPYQPFASDEKKNKNDQKEYFELIAIEPDEADEEGLLPDELFINSPVIKPEKNDPLLGEKTLKIDRTALQPEFIFDKEEGFNALKDVPTLHQQIKDNTNNSGQGKTFNVPQNLPGRPSEDLKKVVTPGERKMFIADLFRGDEIMYERSIKTIDNFSVYAEAEYWIKRELKTKIGWLPNNPTVDYFDRLVKKRFG